MTPPYRRLSVHDLAEVMHDAYEAEAMRVGWATNKQSRVPWERVPEANKRAMRAGVIALVAAYAEDHRQHRNAAQNDQPVLMEIPIADAHSREEFGEAEAFGWNACRDYVLQQIASSHGIRQDEPVDNPKRPVAGNAGSSEQQ